MSHPFHHSHGSTRPAAAVVPGDRVFDMFGRCWRTVEQIAYAGPVHVWFWYDTVDASGRPATERFHHNALVVCATGEAPILKTRPVRCSRCRAVLGTRSVHASLGALLCALCKHQEPLF